MSKEERHLGFGPDYEEDEEKSDEENELAELEYFRSRGFDVSSDPEVKKEVQELLKKLEPMIKEDLEELAKDLIERRTTITP